MKSKPTLLRDLHPRIALWLNLLLVAAAILLLIGIFAPMMTTKKLILFTHQVSLVKALYQLLRGGDYLLFAVIFVFSIVFPIFKLVLLYKVWNGAIQDHGKRTRYLELLAKYGKWSMLDVFVVAVFLVALKLGPLAQVEIHAAVYAFAASVMLTMYATTRISRYAEGVPLPASRASAPDPKDEAESAGDNRMAQERTSTEIDP